MDKGFIIAIEGIDGSGKRSQSDLLQKWLISSGYHADILTYPDYTSNYGQIIKDFLEKRLEISVEEQFYLYLIDMLKDRDFINKRIQAGGIIIIDRYFLSTVAYQCANGYNYESACNAIKLMGFLQPKLVIYLNISIDVGQSRKAKQKGEIDRFESDKEYLRAVALSYDKIKKEYFHGLDWIVIDGSQGIENVHKDVTLKIQELFSEELTMDKKLTQITKNYSELLGQNEKEYDKIRDLKKKMFQMMCLKDYLTDCEPEYCSFRITGVCPYWNTITDPHDTSSKTKKS